MAKFIKKSFTDKNYKSEFIVACLQVKKSNYKDISWAKEMKIMNSLVFKCPDPQFWMHSVTEFKIPSLAWFLTDEGRKYLNDKYKKFKFEFKESKKTTQVNLELEKQGEDIETGPKKVKTLMDFLKKAKK